MTRDATCPRTKKSPLEDYPFVGHGITKETLLEDVYF